MAIEDWDVDLDGKRAWNGAFAVSYYETEDGGISLNVPGGAQDLDDEERLELYAEALGAIVAARRDRG